MCSPCFHNNAECLSIGLFRLSTFTNRWKTVQETTCSSRVATMLPRISRLALVLFFWLRFWLSLMLWSDDVKDIYKRVEGKDLAVKERSAESSED